MTLGHAHDLASFITDSPSSFHAAHAGAARLEKLGYVRQDETEAWDASPGGHYMIRGGALMAWWVPENLPRLRFTILGAHTDSPGYKLKPTPGTQTGAYTQINVESYGGLLGTSWLNRDLGFAGVVSTASGQHLIKSDPCMMIPQLAIHLERSTKDNVSLNMQQHAHPVFSTTHRNVEEYIAQIAGVDEDILGFDLVTYDAQEPSVIGPENDFFMAGRQDNLLSVHAGLVALENLKETNQSVAVFAAFDHEEIGSGSSTGAAGPILETVLRRTGLALGASEEELQRAFADSVCLSADCGHAIHPNYQERHDPDHKPVLGGGVLIKYNANQAYMTDGQGAAEFKQWCHSVGVTTQAFVSRNDQPCGSTIGPLTATRLGIHTIDVGAPLWSMHSVREVSSPVDAHAMSKAIGAFWQQA